LDWLCWIDSGGCDRPARIQAFWRLKAKISRLRRRRSFGVLGAMVSDKSIFSA
jgi:hypothetical protein